MNGRSQEYEHLYRKARDAKRGGHDAWAVQSTGEKVAVALVLNRAEFEDLKTKPRSSLNICLLSADWVMFSLSAARPKCSSSASTIADCSSRISGKTMTILQSADSGRDSKHFNTAESTTECS